MPVYDYLCEKCDHEFEREQRMSDAPLKTCPACKSRKVKRLISRTAFHLKGSGWYKDGYSASGSKSKAPAESPCAGCDGNPANSPASCPNSDSASA